MSRIDASAEVQLIVGQLHRCGIGGAPEAQSADPGPREFLARASVWLGATQDAEGALIVILFVVEGQIAAIAISFRPHPLA